MAEGIEPDINTPARSAFLATLAHNHSDLRAALERALRNADFTGASRLAAALFWFWFHRGLWREGRTFLRAVIEHENSSGSLRARVLLGDGVLAWAEGDLGTAATRLEECITLGGGVDHVDAVPTVAHALHFLAMVRLGESRAAAGTPLAEEAVRKARTTDDAFCLTIARRVRSMPARRPGAHT